MPKAGVNVGKNNYRANYGSWINNGANNNGVFVLYNKVKWVDRQDRTKWGIRASDILDGLSNTAAFSERAMGDETPGTLTMEGDWIHVPDSSTVNVNTGPTVSQNYANACLAAPLNPTDSDSNGGQNWFNGNYRISRYNHVLGPNKPSCTRNAGNANTHGITTATSYHPGGVNMVLCDGSARFVRETVSEHIWRAVGNRKDGLAINAGDL